MGYKTTILLNEFPLKFIADELIISLLFFLIYIVFRTPVLVVSCPDTNTDTVSMDGFISTPVLVLYLNDGAPFEFILSSESYTIVIVFES